MTELSQNSTSANSFSNSLGTGIEKAVHWSLKRWLVFFNLFFLMYLALPFLAPLLLANGYTSAANIIYRLYNATCHQIPSRAYYISGEQVALCYRDVAIYAAIFAGGLLFGLVRHRLRPLHFGWYLLLILPMALDGGLQMISELTQYVPLAALWILGLTIIGGLAFFLYRKKKLNWYWVAIFACGLGGLLYLQFVGLYASNYAKRTITGLIFGFSTVWLVYPYLEEAFSNVPGDKPESIIDTIKRET